MPINKDFYDLIDDIFVINKDASEGKGEDDFYCARSNNSAIVSVFDGTGGLGSRLYPSFQNHTGAYMASKVVSGAVRDWYHSNPNFSNLEQLKQSLSAYINKGYKICESYAVTNNRIRGSMVRDFPTTCAMAIAQKVNEGILLHVIWAGDSRVYLMDRNGLAQLTADDIEDEDAFTNLFNDGVMNNLLSSDGNYELHGKSILVKGPTVVFAATDGCFGYLSTPMEFEYTVLMNLIQAKSPEQFRLGLASSFESVAGDDFTLGMMAFNFGDFNNEKKYFENRLRFVYENYIKVINNENRSDVNYLGSLWEKYKIEYERFLG